MLTTDGVLSFAVMNYAEIGLDKYYGWGSVGVYSPITRRGHLHPNDGRPEILNIPNEAGNTGRLGQLVFRTDDLNVATTTATTTIGTPTGVQQPIYTL